MSVCTGPVLDRRAIGPIGIGSSSDDPAGQSRQGAGHRWWLAGCAEFYIVLLMVTAGIEQSLSVTDASRRGVPGLVADAERGSSVLVSRHGKPAAVVIGVERLESIFRREDDLRSATLVLVRAATDDGRRTSLNEVIESLGFDRGVLEAELEADLDGPPPS